MNSLGVLTCTPCYRHATPEALFKAFCAVICEALMCSKTPALPSRWGDATLRHSFLSNHQRLVASRVFSLRRTISYYPTCPWSNQLRSVPGTLLRQKLTCRESLRDVVACLTARGPGLYHLGFRGHLSRPNLADAGRHAELLTRCETYQQLWNQQTSHL